MTDINITNTSYKYKFSVVMPVYNVCLFLAEAIESVINQDIGFENNIQIILVDDGSTDDSGKICDEYKNKYPDNILVIHKENGGVSEARNTGIPYTEGKYVSFFDPDDKFSLNTFREVYEFFEKHYEETDIVSIPVELFDAIKGEHILNDKYKAGSRVIDLNKEYTHVQYFVNSVFIKKDIADKTIFDKRLKIAEDAKFVFEVLSHKSRLGVLDRCTYYYRIRSKGEKSAMQNAKRNKNWYIGYIEYFLKDIIEYYNKKFTCIPKYMQYNLMYNLQHKVLQRELPQGVLTKDEEINYKESLFRCISTFDDEIILIQNDIGLEYKDYLLYKKYNRTPDLYWEKGGVISFSNKYFTNLGEYFTQIDAIRFSNNMVNIEGCMSLPLFAESKDVSIYIKANDVLIKADSTSREEYMLLGERVCASYGFNAAVPLNKLKKKTDIRFYMKVDGYMIEKKVLSYSRLSPIGTELKQQHYHFGKWFVTAGNDSIRFTRGTFIKAIYKEAAYLVQILKLKERNAHNLVAARAAYNAAAARTIYHIIKHFKRKEIWLLSDKVIKTGGSGEALFRYLMQKHSNERKYYFILDKKCPDYDTLIKEYPKNVLPFFSHKHKFMHIFADSIVSSCKYDVTVNPFEGAFYMYRDIINTKSYVFLQNETNKNDDPEIVYNYIKSAYGCSEADVSACNSSAENNIKYQKVWFTDLQEFDAIEKQ